MTSEHYILQLVCPNRPGIVAAVSSAIYELGGNIREAQQFDDPESNRFFARIVLDARVGAGAVEISETDNDQGDGQDHFDGPAQRRAGDRCGSR